MVILFFVEQPSPLGFLTFVLQALDYTTIWPNTIYPIPKPFLMSTFIATIHSPLRLLPKKSGQE